MQTLSSDERKFLDGFNSLSPVDQQRMRRIMFRLNNGSGRLDRLFDLFMRGQLSASDLLRIAGD